ncbi:MAG TPA: hypothetical protein DCQ33_14600 [Nitrospira sp.]|nr:hypothetical protein [Nitrospira sp.]
MRGNSILPDAPKRWRPKTRAAALAALEDSRRYAARLEATARQQEAREQELSAELAKLRASADSGQNELTHAKERLARAEQQKSEKAKENYKRKRQTERLVDRLKKTEREVTRKEKALDKARIDLAALRRAHEQQTAVQANQLTHARAEVTELSKSRDELAAQAKKLAEMTEQLEQRAADAEQKLKQRNGELDNERKQADEAKRGQHETQAHIELLQRRLEAEQARRTAAEQKLEQAAQTGGSPSQAAAPAMRTQLSMSSLRLGRYQGLAAALGYDHATDGLFDLMHEEVRVAATYADWQASHMERITARRRDPEQSIDEQSFAATLAARWRLIDHPHLRLGLMPQWGLHGFLLDDRSEKYLLTITKERIDEMRSRILNSHLAQ